MWLLNFFPVYKNIIVQEQFQILYLFKQCISFFVRSRTLRVQKKRNSHQKDLIRFHIQNQTSNLQQILKTKALFHLWINERLIKPYFGSLPKVLPFENRGSMRSFESSIISFEGYNQPNLDNIRGSVAKIIFPQFDTIILAFV